MKYRAADWVTHSVTNELISPGGLVDVSHLTPDQVLMLCDMGALEAVPDTYTPPAVVLDTVELPFAEPLEDEEGE